MVKDDDANLSLGPGSIDDAVEKYYKDTPVALLVDSLDTPETGGLTATGRKNGFAVISSLSADHTIAHEIGHMLIPRMYLHGFYATHVGNDHNLMASGQAAENAGADLSNTFLTEAQAQGARDTINRKVWSK